MKTIYKYPLNLVTEQDVRMPEGAHLLSVHEQNGTPTIWAEVDTDRPLVYSTVWIVGTGNPMPFETKYMESPRYLGTVPMVDGLVWHIYYR